MVEDDPVVAMLHHFDVLFQHELHYVEFAAGQSEEIFELYADSVEWFAKHFVALDEPIHTL